MEIFEKKFQLKGDEGKCVLAELIKGAELTRFGLHNAITRASQEVEDYDRATEMERIGGQIIELKPNEWMEMVKAA